LPIIESIVSQHAEEAAFLWLLRDLAVAAPHYSLQDLADLDERVEAHIDGLRVAGDPGWVFCSDGSSSLNLWKLLILFRERQARVNSVGM